VPIVLDTKGPRVQPGDLALVSKGRGRAKVERNLGTARRIENVLRGLLVEQGYRGALEPYELPRDARVEPTCRASTVTIDPETAKGLRRRALVARGDRRDPVVSPHRRRVVVRPPELHSITRFRRRSRRTSGLVAPMLPHGLADDACSLRPLQAACA
jgi:hypothetical protein